MSTEAQQLDRCNRSLQRAQESLALDGPQRVSALMAARDEIDATIRVLRWRPRSRPTPAAMAVLTVCIGLFAVVGIETARLLTAGRPAPQPINHPR